MIKVNSFLLFFIGLMTISFAQPTINGDLSDTEYITIGTKENTNSSFGSAIDVSKMVYYSDPVNQKLYVGIEGKLDVGANNGIGLFLNFSGLNGVAAGSNLGFDGAGHYMDGESGGTNDDFRADFEVDYMFAMNPGAGTTNVFLDAAKVVGGNTSVFLGSTDQIGGTTTSSDAFGTGGTATFAFNNGGGGDQGFKIVFDYAYLGIDETMTMQAFTFVVSETGFFSDVTVPGNITTGQPGFNADYSTLSGGDYFTSSFALPVRLGDYSVSLDNDWALINWTTLSEINNDRFEIYRSANGRIWELLGTVKPQWGRASGGIRHYEYTDRKLTEGSNYYLLKQVDTDGTETDLGVRKITYNPTNVELYPTFVSDILQFTIPKNFASGSARIYNAQGYPVMILRQLSEASSSQRLDVGALPAGTYIFQWTSLAGEREVKRFVKF